MRSTIDRSAILRLTGRTAFFLFACTLILFMLFLIGNYQRFLDHNQRLIMTFLSATLVLELATGAFYFIFLIQSRRLIPRPSRGRLIALLIALVFSFLLFIVLEFFHAWI